MLSGGCTDLLSACGGMDIRYDSMDWTTAEPVALAAGAQTADGHAMLNWTFGGGYHMGAGNHIFYGRAQDGAGNQETPYEIGRVLWFPQAAPDLNGSTLSASPTIVRPGEIITYSLVARNGGRQETHVAAVATLPAGLSLVTETLAAGVVYDPIANTVTWPARLLWPDEWVRHTFNARAGSPGVKTTLTVQAALQAAWPNSELLPPDQRQLFVAQERSGGAASLRRFSCLVHRTIRSRLQLSSIFILYPFPDEQHPVVTRLAPFQNVSTLSASTVHWHNWTIVLTSTPSSSGMLLMPRASQQVPHAFTCPPRWMTALSMRSML